MMSIRWGYQSPFIRVRSFWGKMHWNQLHFKCIIMIQECTLIQIQKAIPAVSSWFTEAVSSTVFWGSVASTGPLMDTVSALTEHRECVKRKYKIIWVKIIVLALVSTTDKWKWCNNTSVAPGSSEIIGGVASVLGGVVKEPLTVLNLDGSVLMSCRTLGAAAADDMFSGSSSIFNDKRKNAFLNC